MKVRTEARRAAILEAARKLFLEHGFERTSMSELARVLGGSKATIYGYFSSKEVLFVAATELEGGRMLQALLEDLHQREGLPLRQALLAFGEALVRFMDSGPAVAAYRMVMAEAGRTDVGRMLYEQGPKRGMQQVAMLLRQAIRRGELTATDMDTDTAALHLHGLLTSELLPRMFDRHAKPLADAQVKALVQRAVDVFLRGYGAAEL